MLIIISPAKTIDMEGSADTGEITEPVFLKDAKKLMTKLKKLKPHQLSELMSISPKLAELNYRRNQEWKLPFKPENTKQALLAFKGEVYTGLEAATFNPDDFIFAQDHLRILSGLYGLLRPLDQIMAYRLEMGIRFQSDKWKDLYDFWQSKITRQITNDLKNTEDNILINLASNEYFKSIDPKKLKSKIISPVFKDMKNGEYKMISFFAKKARGLMTRFIILNKITNPDNLKLFDSEGYYYNENLSDEVQFVFTRG